MKLRSPFDSTAPLYSFLDNLDMLKSSADPYHLRLCYPELTQHSFPCNEWSQTKNPLGTTSLAAVGYTLINVTFNTDGTSVTDGPTVAFGGLAKNKRKMNDDETIIDANPQSTDWWFSIGSLQYYKVDGKLPGPKVPVTKVEMYMKRSQPPSLQSGRRKRSITETLVKYVQSQERVKRAGSDESAVETEEEIAVRSYGSRLRYECGPARQFYDDFSQELYNERWMECNWNQTWTRTDVLDTCSWIQCLNPPEVRLPHPLVTAFSSHRRKTRSSWSGMGFRWISTPA